VFAVPRSMARSRDRVRPYARGGEEERAGVDRAERSGITAQS